MYAGAEAAKPAVIAIDKRHKAVTNEGRGTGRAPVAAAISGGMIITPAPDMMTA